MPVSQGPTHLTRGLSNTIVGPFADIDMLGGPNKILYWNDFLAYVAGDWTITGTGSPTQALANVAGGVLLLTNGATDDNNCFLQLKGEPFKFTRGKKMAFGCRFQVSDATQIDVVVGLQITDTTPLDTTDGIFFIKDDDAATFSVRVEKDDVASVMAAAGSIANNTWVELGWYYDGDVKIYAFKDGVVLGSLPITNAPDDEELTVSIGCQNGSSGAKTMSIDWVRAVQER